MKPLRRPRFFPGRLLSVDDLVGEQEYQRERMRRHNRLLHGWGVVSGLDVAAAPNETQPWLVSITPGHALAPNGDEIVVCAATSFDLAPWQAAAARPLLLVIRHAEEAVGPMPVPGTDIEAEASWLIDSFVLVVIEPEDDSGVPGMLPCDPDDERAVERAGSVVLARILLPASSTDPIDSIDTSVRRGLAPFDPNDGR